MRSSTRGQNTSVNTNGAITQHPITIKKFSIEDITCLLDNLYKEVEHGDNEHRKWLKDKFVDFTNRKILNNS